MFCYENCIVLLMWFLLCLKPLGDEKKVTSVILDALRETGQRGIISRGWGDLGSCKLFLNSNCASFQSLQCAYYLLM